MIEKYHAVVVGASLAGASAAITLARKGLRVCLLDSGSFPRHKPCGEGLSSYGLNQLEILGLRGAVLELPSLEYSGYCIKAGDTRTYLRAPWGKGITIQRTKLDTALVAAATATPGVDVLLSQKVREIRPNFIGTESKQFSSKATILACGGNSSLLKKVGCQTKRMGPSRAGITVTFNGAFLDPPKFVHILVKRGYEIYCTPLAEGRLNVSILAPTDSPLNLKDILLSPDNIAEVFQEMGYRGQLELAATGRSGIGNVRRATAMPSVFLAGDAKEEFDPIGGMGMSHALRSGILTAEAVTEYILGNRSLRQSAAWYRAQSKQSLAAMRTFTGISYQTLRASARFPALLRVASSPVAGRVLRMLTKELV